MESNVGSFFFPASASRRTFEITRCRWKWRGLRFFPASTPWRSFEISRRRSSKLRKSKVLRFFPVKEQGASLFSCFIFIEILYVLRTANTSSFWHLPWMQLLVILRTDICATMIDEKLNTLNFVSEQLPTWNTFPSRSVATMHHVAHQCTECRVLSCNLVHFRWCIARRRKECQGFLCYPALSLVNSCQSWLLQERRLISLLHAFAVNNLYSFVCKTMKCVSLCDHVIRHDRHYALIELKITTNCKCVHACVAQVVQKLCALGCCTHNCLFRNFIDDTPTPQLMLVCSIFALWMWRLAYLNVHRRCAIATPHTYMFLVCMCTETSWWSICDDATSCELLLINSSRGVRNLSNTNIVDFTSPPLPAAHSTVHATA